MKQTAVEWLKEQFKVPNSDSYISKTFQQALEIERKQIKDAYNQGYRDADDYTEEDVSLFEDADLYYNETYKKDKL